MALCHQPRPRPPVPRGGNGHRQGRNPLSPGDSSGLHTDTRLPSGDPLPISRWRPCPQRPWARPKPPALGSGSHENTPSPPHSTCVPLEPRLLQKCGRSRSTGCREARAGSASPPRPRLKRLPDFARSFSLHWKLSGSVCLFKSASKNVRMGFFSSCFPENKTKCERPRTSQGHSLVPKCPGLHSPSVFSGSAARLQLGASAPLLSAPHGKSWVSLASRTRPTSSVYVRVCVHRHVCVSACLCMHVCGYVPEYECMHMWCIYVCMCVHECSVCA